MSSFIRLFSYWAKAIALFSFAAFALTLHAQTPEQLGSNNPWRATLPPLLQLQQQVTTVPTDKAAYYTLDSEQLSQVLKQISLKQIAASIILPHPNFKFGKYTIKEIDILPKSLSSKYPSIKTYKGIGEKGQQVWISTDTKGIHATILSQEGNVYIDKLKHQANTYRSYFKKDAQSKALQWQEEVLENPYFSMHARQGAPHLRTRNSTIKNETLRTFRLAVATTGEYTQYHGGTVEDALGAITTAIVRVNSIFEREIGVRLLLVENNDKVIFTDPDTDPFTNADTYALIEENETVLNDSIGIDNFDVGHVFFGKSFSGLAYVNSVCTPNKAGATSGHPEPDADPFFVDVLCHEFGHQFGAYHSHNADCNRTSGSAFEPASGSTIMAYTGICPPNLQNNSDDYFHAGSIEEMLNFLGLISCGQTIPTENLAPNITEMPTAGLTIPTNTFFELGAQAEDPNGDTLFYAWDQIDLGPQSTLNSPIGNAPIFRSFPYSKSPNRYFPRLSTQLGGQAAVGENLPTYSRDLNFRFIVRDLKGGTAFQDMSMKVDGEAGPFQLDENQLESTYYFDEEISIEWDVAGTSAAPINCDKVDILLSLDNGQSFGELLLDDTENDGQAFVKLPRKEAEKARIKVKASNNVFYALSTNTFSIETPVFSLEALSDTLFICGSDATNSSLQISSRDYSANGQKIALSVSQLPTGIALLSSNLELNPGENGNIEFSIDESVQDTLFEAELIGTINNFQFSDKFVISYAKAIPEKIVLISPANQTDFVDLQPSFIWAEANSATTNFQFELSDEPTFSNKVLVLNMANKSNLASPIKLAPSTTYYWRVLSRNNCGEGELSEVFSFTTSALLCEEFAADDLPKTIENTVNFEVTSTLEVPQIGIVEDISVKSISGKHTFINDLVFELLGPDGTRITLLNQQCSSEDDFNLGFDDDSGLNEIDCPPTSGFIYQPEESLATFKDKPSEGIWQLIVTDKASEDGGQLENWTLELCIKPPEFRITSNLSSFNEVTLQWEFSSGAVSEFILERKTGNSDAFEAISSISAEENSFTDTNLQENTTYQYRIKALTANNYFAYSSISEITTGYAPAERPSNLIATSISTESVTLNWTDNADNEDNYEVWRSLGNIEEFSLIAILSANQDTFVDVGLQDNSEYHYLVTAIRNEKKSFSDTLIVKTLELPPTAPQNLEAVEINTNSIVITWEDLANNETGYKIFRSAANLEPLELLTTLPVNTTQFEDNNLVDDATYRYMVSASGNTADTYSDTITVSTLPLPPAKPTELNAFDISTNSLTIQWEDNANNETAYRLLRKEVTAIDFGTIIELPVNTIQYSEVDLKHNTTYQYLVEAVRENVSSFSDTFSVKTLELPPTPPHNLQKVQATSNSITIAWEDLADNETSYQIFRSDANQNQLKLLTALPINTAQFEDNNLLDDATYRYMVSATGNTGDTYSDTLAVSTLPLPPNAATNLNAVDVSTNSLTLKWQDNADNETAYRLLRKKAASPDFVTIVNLPANATQYNDTNLEDNTNYQYLVEALGEIVSSFSDTLSIKTLITAPLAPSSLSIQQIDAKSIELSWLDQADNESAYLVIRSLGNSNTKDTLATLAANTISFRDTFNIEYMTIYNYSIIAVNNGGSSEALSGEFTTIEAPPSSPSNLEVTAIDAREINIIWQDNADNEDAYEIHLAKADSLNYTLYQTLEANSFSALIENLQPATVYFIKVRAVNTGGVSSFTASLKVETPPAVLIAPSNLRFASVPAQEVQLIWDNNEPQPVAILVERSTGTNKDFKEIAITKTGATSFTDSEFTPGNQYYYRVAAYDGTEQSEYSNEIFVPSEITSLPLSTEAQFSVYPNPAIRDLFIETENNQLEIKHLRIIDANGKMCLERYYDGLQNNTIRIDLQGLSNGVYIIQINHYINAKIIKL